MAVFYDRAKIYVKGGDGGNGAIAFRREKYVPQGGPAGGDGGRGGDVVLVGDPGLSTLIDFKYKRHYRADRGSHGEGKNRFGRHGSDLEIRCPVGTIVREGESQRVIADIDEAGKRVVVARGGRGGRGNTRFAGRVHQAPRLAENGEPGEELFLELELKLLADVALVGMPNAGKSTLIAAMSAARPKIAAYPFTTLQPNLGVVRLEEGESFVVADVPGLIAGAHSGSGLGHEFLRHVERSRLLVQVVDAAQVEGRDALGDVDAIQRELELYQPVLLERVKIIVANKMDLPGAVDNLARLRDKWADEYEILPVAAATGAGVRELISLLAVNLRHQPAPSLDYGEPFIVSVKPEKFEVQQEENRVFRVIGREIEKHLAMTRLDEPEGLRRLQQIITAMGLEKELRRQGAQTGDLIRIGNEEFDFLE